jgi:hypothetical protein
MTAQTGVTLALDSVAATGCSFARRSTGNHKAGAMIDQSLITCPQCGTAKLEQMPVDACQFFYHCTGCGARLKPKPGDCCVFCSYGSVPCPPVQARQPGPPAV